METTILNYRIIVKPDKQTGTNKSGFTAICPTLGIADDGDTVEESLSNIKNAIKVYIDVLTQDHLPIPKDEPEKEIVTTAQIKIKGNFHFA